MKVFVSIAKAAVEQYVKEGLQRAVRVANDPAVKSSARDFGEAISRSWLRNGSPAAT